MKNVEVGQIWKRRNFRGGFDYLIVRRVITNEDGLREKYCEITNIEHLTEYKDWIFPDVHELINDYLS